MARTSLHTSHALLSRFFFSLANIFRVDTRKLTLIAPVRCTCEHALERAKSGASRSQRITTISFGVVPVPLIRKEAIHVLWLEISPLDQQAAVGPMRAFNLRLLGKNLLNSMIALVTGTSNPDALCLIDGWQNHSFFSLSLTKRCGEPLPIKKPVPGIIPNKSQPHMPFRSPCILGQTSKGTLKHYLVV